MSGSSQNTEVSNPEGSNTQVSPPSPSTSPSTFLALCLGLFAASTYSVANMALRGLTRDGASVGWDMWVAGTKALPTFLVAVTLIAIRRAQGKSSFAEWSFVWPIAVSALFNQLGGNFAFQMSLSIIGLAISVPICFASIICSGAVVGRVVLGDAVTARTGISMGLMVASIVFLSNGAGARTAPDVVNTTQSENDAVQDVEILENSLEVTPRKNIAAGVGLSIVSGLCYGVTGVFIRKAVRSHMPVAATLFLFSAAGFLVLCPLSMVFLKAGEIAQTTSTEMWTMVTAGTFNAIGFFAITHAMRQLTISRANIINASQNAMCAIGAVLVFREVLTTPAIAGILLTIAGLLVLDRK